MSFGNIMLPRISFILFAFTYLVIETTAYRSSWYKFKTGCWVKCEEGCRKVRKEDGSGCYRCDCEPMCIPPKCEAGCTIQKLPGDLCPTCDCKTEDSFEDIPAAKICDPVQCDPGCTEVMREDACPECMCPLCSPPKCPEGCKVETVYDGPCPGCDCEDAAFEIDIRSNKAICDPPKCPPGCELQTVFEGPCPGCDCLEEVKKLDDKVVCDPPKCLPGCKLQTVFDGPCPACECEEDIEKCPLLDACEDPCKVETDENGCKVCFCEPKCKVPKCNRRCRVKEVEGECPVCECPRRRPSWKD